MGKATLLNDREFQRDYRIPDARIITLKLEDDYSQISFWDDNGKQMGLDNVFSFKESEFDYNRYLLWRMYTPIQRSGLGQAALEFFTELSGATVFVRPMDGLPRDDQSHLTEMAFCFVPAMQKIGLIENY